MRQLPLAIGPETFPTFDSFVIGQNAAAVEHLTALAPPAPAVYLWGPSGSGKTHLLRALAHRLQSSGSRAGWFAPADPLPWAVETDWALIVVDECDQLDGAAQLAAFTLFGEAASRQMLFAAAGRQPPVDLCVRDDLRTRLAWGHVFALQPPNEEQSRAALRREADRRGVFLSDEVMDFVLRRFTRDMKHLMQLLDAIDEFALAASRPITVPLVKRMLDEQAQTESAGR